MKKNNIVIPDSSSFSEEEQEVLDKIWQLNRILKESFLERDEIIDCLFIALIGSEHILQIGPPGTAKTLLNKAFTACFKDFRFFKKQLTKTTNPDELYGPVDIEKYKQGVFARITKGKIPDVEIVDLDEVFNSNSAVQNLNLEAMNERTYDNKPIPLQLMIGSTNTIPKSGDSDAFFDRFMIRIYADPIKDLKNFYELLELEDFDFNLPVQLTMQDIELLRNKLKEISIKDVKEILGNMWQLLRSEHVEPSDRRFKKSVKLLKAKALLDGRTSVIEDDLNFLLFTLWNEKKEIRIVKTCIMKSISPKAAELADLEAQAISLNEGLKNLSSNNNNDLPKISEIIKKMQKVESDIEKIAADKKISANVQESAQKALINVNKLIRKAMETQLGLKI